MPEWVGKTTNAINQNSWCPTRSPSNLDNHRHVNIWACFVSVSLTSSVCSLQVSRVIVAPEHAHAHAHTRARTHTHRSAIGDYTKHTTATGNRVCYRYCMLPHVWRHRENKYKRAAATWKSFFLPILNHVNAGNHKVLAFDFVIYQV
jgi:hypothetical protein